ncbi:MAG TPA: ParB/RepB/Spo0J family partition protein [Isosphaeraceae bacterium]|jgi:ParB family chromosome partitioning protein|nr:ParB/RepB/Spo0J family partition protein [Isosphaeraceae bacterium]
MGKMDDLIRVAGAHIDESMGAGDSPRITPTAGAAPARWRGVTKARDAAHIPLGMIERDPSQPREEFDPEALGRLADSLRARGQLQPVRVRWDEGRGAYIIVVGERRWRAAKVAGLETLSCVIVERADDPDELLALQLVENALREDLRPVEQARAYRRLMEARGWSSRRLADELHVGQASVVRALALLDLPATVREKVEQGALPASVAYEVSKLPEAGDQAAVAAEVVDRALNRAEAAELVRAVRAGRPSPPQRPEPVEVDLGDGVTVTVRWKRPSPTTAAQALRKALKVLQQRDRADERAA